MYCELRTQAHDNVLGSLSGFWLTAKLQPTLAAKSANVRLTHVDILEMEIAFWHSVQIQRLTSNVNARRGKGTSYAGQC